MMKKVAPVEFATPQPPSIIDSTAFSPTVEDSHETQTYSSRTLVVNRDIPKDHCTIAPSQRTPAETLLIQSRHIPYNSSLPLPCCRRLLARILFPRREFWSQRLPPRCDR
ncbi:hypothetical protein DTO280E4_2146 [Paecilomyces variotii]|nr:hypothetical protein DTO280E4_2146 [Paecilomyces variotii]